MEILKTKSKNFDKIIFSIILSALLFSIFFIGPLVSGDTPHYDNQSKILLDIGFVEYFKTLFIGFDRPYFLYLGTILYTYFFKFLFGNLWKLFFIIANLTFTFYIFYNLYKNLSKINISKILFLLLFFLNIEHIQWNYYILGESIYNFLICLIFFTIIGNLSKDIPIKKSFLVLFLLGLILIFTKPSGSFVIGFYILASIFLYFLKRKDNKSIFKLILLIKFSIFFLFSLFFSMVNHFDLIFLKNEFVLRLLEIINTGVVIDSGRAERLYTIDMGNKSLLNYLNLFIYKFFYFFKFWNFNFWSLKHNLINFLVFLPLYTSIISSYLFFNKFSYKEKKKIIICFSLIISIAIFHALTIIDFSFRFRLPTYCAFYYLLILNLNLLQNKIFIFQQNMYKRFLL